MQTDNLIIRATEHQNAHEAIQHYPFSLTPVIRIGVFCGLMVHG